MYLILVFRLSFSFRYEFNKFERFIENINNI